MPAASLSWTSKQGLPPTFEGHDGDLHPRAVQPPQPFGLSLAVLAEVEARGEDSQTEVGVPS